MKTYETVRQHPNYTLGSTSHRTCDCEAGAVNEDT
jgi:hypothetical protein